MARVLCAMSGGVDSSVAAYLLKQAGHDVVGVFLRLGPDAVADVTGVNALLPRSRACCSVEDSRDAALVASRLAIPFYSMNYQGEFGRIIDHFVDEYHRGRTPIPCILCNQWLKFGSLLDKARALGCDAIATGHYARIRRHPDGHFQLLRSRQARKDQSYFLFLMPKSSLERTLFPLGELDKSQVRELARACDLPVAEKAESQEICFVPNDDYREVLRARSPHRMRPGRFVDLSGRVLGTHDGYQNFTVGQRRGTGVALGTPHYVVALDPQTNTVTLGERDKLRSREAVVTEVQWTSLDPDPAADLPLRVTAQIRHRHTPRPAEVVPRADGSALVRFDEPQEAITPGQAAVFYDGDVVLGGGWIAAAGSRGDDGAP